MKNREETKAMSEVCSLSREETKQLKKQLQKRNDSLEGGSFWRNLDFVIYLFSVLVFAFAIRTVIVEPMRVKGASMETTLHAGDYMAVDKLTYVFSDMRRGDIVICYYPQNDEYTCVKRVIGLEGDRVVIEEGIVYVNGHMLTEDYLTMPRNSYHDGEWTVAEGCIFVLGDNREVSRDSSNELVGSIPEERVIGRVRMVLLPFKDIRTFPGIDYGF